MQGQRFPVEGGGKRDELLARRVGTRRAALRGRRKEDVGEGRSRKRQAALSRRGIVERYAVLEHGMDSA